MNKHVVTGLLAFACCTTVFGGALDGRHLAIVDMSMHNPNGTFRTTQISATSSRKECETALAGIISGQEKGAQKHKASVTRHKQGCVTELPPELIEVGEGLPLAGAYYTTKTIPLNAGKFISIDIFFGLDESNPQGMCNRMIEVYRPQYPDIKCVPPAK